MDRIEAVRSCKIVLLKIKYNPKYFSNGWTKNKEKVENSNIWKNEYEKMVANMFIKKVQSEKVVMVFFNLKQMY